MPNENRNNNQKENRTQNQQPQSCHSHVRFHASFFIPGPASLSSPICRRNTGK